MLLMCKYSLISERYLKIVNQHSDDKGNIFYAALKRGIPIAIGPAEIPMLMKAKPEDMAFLNEPSRYWAAMHAVKVEKWGVGRANTFFNVTINSKLEGTRNGYLGLLPRDFMSLAREKYVLEGERDAYPSNFQDYFGEPLDVSD